jgi:hypothetical protein
LDQYDSYRERKKKELTIKDRDLRFQDASNIISRPKNSKIMYQPIAQDEEDKPEQEFDDSEFIKPSSKLNFRPT